MALTPEEQAAVIDALVSARKRISFYESQSSKRAVYQEQNADAMRKIAAALAVLDFDGDGDEDD
jgi:hypothetical protein